MKLGHKRTKKAFTLIELSFAVGFISVLLITVTLITNEIIQIYRKGYNIKTINQVGRDVIDDFQSSIIQSLPNSLSTFCSNKYEGDENNLKNCNANHGLYSIYQQYYTNVKITSGGDSGTKTVPTGGIFCSGKYTYLWNTGYMYNTKDYEFSEQDVAQKKKLKVKYTLPGETTPQYKENFRLIKIEDPSGSICLSTLENKEGPHYPTQAEAVNGPNGSSNYEIVINQTLSKEPEDILSATDADLVLYDLVIFEPARVTTTNRLLFSGSFILGTTGTGVDIMSASDFCKTPDYFNYDFSYCAINKFNFTIQSSSK